MGNRIFFWIILLGSLAYGVVAVGAAMTSWRTLPTTIHALERMHSAQALNQARYLQSPWHQGELVLTLLAGVCFLSGAVGWRARQTWGRMTLFAGAWLALAQMAWTLIVSLEWFRNTGTGMLYQINLLNVVWVVVMLALMPTERMAQAWR